jgi:hypothetical protein
MSLPPFKGTMLDLGLDPHQCAIGLSFRWNWTPDSILSEPSKSSYFPPSDAIGA